MPFDPFHRSTKADPYPFYRQLRDAGPAHYFERYDMWMVGRYAAVEAILHDPITFSSERGMGDFMVGAIGGDSLGAATDAPAGRMFTRGSAETFVGEIGRRLLIASDPPNHSRLRRMVSRPFSARSIAAHEPSVRRICTEMLDHMLEAGEGADLVQHLAYPLPVTVIANLLGIPAERRDDFKRWSDDMVTGLGAGGSPNALGSMFEMFEYFGEVVAQRSERPVDDLISTLVVAQPDGDEPLTSGEVVMFCVLLLIAGNETTTNLLSNWARVMFERPDVMTRLRERPALIPWSLEETLRYDAPVQSLFRATTRDADLDGARIPANSMVMVAYGAANRDERRYADPDAFVVDRNPTDHLGFGAGIHFCLGAALARLEARVAAEELLRRTRSIEPAGDAAPLDSFFLRGLVRMPVRAEAA